MRLGNARTSARGGASGGPPAAEHQGPDWYDSASCGRELLCSGLANRFSVRSLLCGVPMDSRISRKREKTHVGHTKPFGKTHRAHYSALTKESQL